MSDPKRNSSKWPTARGASKAIAPKPTAARSRTDEKLRAFHEEGGLGKAYDVRLFKRLIPFITPHRKFVIVSLTTLAVVSILNLIRPLFMGATIGYAERGDAEGVMRQGLYLALLIIFTQSTIFVQTYTMQIAGARAMADLREHIFLFLQRVSLRHFDKTPIGRLVTRGTNDVDALAELFASGVLNAMGDLISLIGIVIVMVNLDARLALIAFVSMPAVFIAVQFIRRRSREAYRDIRTKTARLNSVLSEQVNGMAVVQAYGREDAIFSEFDAVNVSYTDANKTSVFYEAVLDAVIEMVNVVCIAAILWYAGFRRLGAHPVTFATMVTFTAYIRQFFEPISTLSQRYTVLQSAMSGAERIFQLLDDAETETDHPGESTEAHADEALAFDAVSFEYKPGVPVIENVSFSIKKGEKIALVGATGAGKTTVTSILLRLYELKSGSARVFGKDVRAYDRRELRKLFSVVPQDVFLFSGDILSNVAMSDDHPDEARARLALERLGALPLFERRAAGLHAPVDERGSNFSGGERQLLAFARAVYRDSPILILDEATASVDSDTEARLHRAFEAMIRDKTALIIAHRLSTIRSVDRILVFHKGHIVENGTHDELLAKRGVYAKLYELQFAHEAPVVSSPVSDVSGVRTEG